MKTMEIKPSPSSRCPHCNSEKTFALRPRMMSLSVFLLIVGIILSPVIIGVPLIGVAAIVFVQALHTKESTFSCRTCNGKFKALWVEG